MKKIFLVALVTLPVFSQARDSFDGCGLGWEVTDKKTMVATTTRATTNFVVPPTFGMTSGTLGCNEFEGFAALEKQNAEYIAKNYDVIRSELAMGQGDYANAASESLNCQQETFLPHVQKNFDTVVAPAQNGIELYKNLRDLADQVCS